MRRIRFVALALIGCLTPYIFPSNEAYAQQSRQRELSGVWTSTGDGFRGNDRGCHLGGGGHRFRTPEFTIVQNGNSISIPGNFSGWEDPNSNAGGYGKATSGEVSDNQFTLTSTAGRFTNEYTGTISDDGNKITGRVLCRYSGGSATATGSFTFTRKDRTETKRIRVWLTGFIPTPIAVIPGPNINNTKCSTGDGRGYSNSPSETRYRFRHMAEFEVEVKDKKITRVQLLGAQPSVSPTHFVDCQTGQILQTGQSQDQPQFSYEQVGDRGIKVRFTGRLRHGILRELAPAIDYDVEALIDPVNETKVSVVGGRNQYPAYEMYMSVQKQDEPPGNAITLLQYMPDGLTRTPVDLFGGPNTPATSPGSDFGSEGRNAGEWSGQQAGEDAAQDLFKNPNNPSPSTPSFDGFGGGSSGGAGSSTLW